MSVLIDDIAGHEKERGQLLADIASGNVSHAYLFSGSPHIGKSTIARWFATTLLCDQLEPGARKTVSEQIERLIHPDFLSLDALWIEEDSDDWNVIAKSSNAPQQHRSKAPTAKTDTISIEDVRALSDRLQSTGNNKYFCCMIRGIERMQPAAANAFLKILEEPPPRVVFILTTDNQSLVLPTVISRTRVLRFSPLKNEQMRALIQGRDDDDAVFALHLAQGAPGSLITLLSDPESLREGKQLHAQAKQFWQTSSLKDRFGWLMLIAGKKINADEAMLHLGLTLRELPDPAYRATCVKAYTELTRNLRTNANAGLLLERFALAIQER